MARRKSSVTVINDGIDALDDFLQSLRNLSLKNNDKVVPSNQNKKIAPQSQKKYYSTRTVASQENPAKSAANSKGRGKKLKEICQGSTSTF